MANKKLVKIAMQGRKAIAQWRQLNQEMLLDLRDANLNGADLRGANLKRADLVGADLRGANLVSANLSEADLTRARLSNAKLIKVDLHNSRLFKSTFNGADLSGANLRKANFESADLSESKLTKADFLEADFTSADLSKANLVRTDLSHSVQSGTRLTEATVGWTCFGNLDLSNTTGLDTLNHIGPSTLGVDTLIRSKSSLPPDFLRGCGVPESLISNLETMFDDPFQGISCFICHTKEEFTFARKLYDTFQEKGIRCWMDERPAKPGVDPYKDVSPDFRWQHKIILCATKFSLTSWWIEEVLDSTLEEEARLKKVTGKNVGIIFPVNLDGFMFSGDWKYKNEKSVAAKLAGDFTGWRRNLKKFDSELIKLLDVLK